MNTLFRILFVSSFTFILTMSLGGCGTLFGDNKVDYRKSAKLPPLEVPPDLTQPSVDERYDVPDSKATSSATYSTYSSDRGGFQTAKPTKGEPNVLLTADKATVERSGAQRWLSIKASPEQVWLVVRQFWLDAGYQLKSENSQLGVMETEWLEGKPKIPESGIRGVLQRALGTIYSTGMRDKFRTRLERGAEGSTEIYISHRGMEEVYEGTSKEQTIWQPRASDPELEAEMLQKLLVKFGVDENKAKTTVAETSAPRARLVPGDRLVVIDPFDRAWRRVGLALDRVGFTVEDRDRSQGTYFVRYIDPQADSPKVEKGFLSKLMFWKSDAKTMDKAQYRIRIKETASESIVEVENAAGEPEKTSTGNRILGLLFDQLK